MPTHGLVIAPAVAEDTPLIMEFIRELATYEKLADQVTADETDLRTTLFGPCPAAEVLIARVAGEPAGFALYFPNYSTFLGRPGLYLEDLYVRPEHRGRGVGGALLRRLARLASERGCGRFEWAVLDWNETAINVYRRLGARPQSEWTVWRVDGDALDELAGEDA